MSIRRHVFLFSTICIIILQIIVRFRQKSFIMHFNFSTSKLLPRRIKWNFNQWGFSSSPLIISPHQSGF